MTEEKWRALKRPQALWLHRQVGISRQRRLVVCACARRLLPLVDNDARAVALLEVTERYADAPAAEAPAVWHEVTAARKAFRTFAVEFRARATRNPRRTNAADVIYRTSEAVIARTVTVFTDAVTATKDKPLAPGVTETAAQLAICRDVFGNPFRPVAFAPEWRTDTVTALAAQMYESRDFGAMPILADALQDAGCDSDDLLNHCRDPEPVHVRGCWVVDLVLGKS